MKERRLWAFGCSFTEGIFTAPTIDGKTYHFPTNDRRLNWPHYLGFDLLHFGTVYNKGRGAASMQYIFYQIVEYINDIKPNDVVIIGHTQPERASLFPNGTKKVGERGLLKGFPLVPWMCSMVLEGDIELLKEIYTYDSNKLTKEVLEDACRSFISLASSGVLEEHFNLYNHLIDNLEQILIKNNIEVYHWYWDLWNVNKDGDNELNDSLKFFENIEVWSKGYLKDTHWSPNGNFKAAHFFKYCIDRGYKNFDREYIKDFYKEWEKLNLPYINYFNYKIV